MLKYQKKLFIIGFIVILSMVFSGVIVANDNWVRVSQDEDAVSFKGPWESTDVDEAFNGVERIDSREGSYVEFEFEGSGVRVLGSKGPVRGKADIYINGEQIETIDAYSDSLEYQKILFSIDDLEDGTHTIRIDPTADKNENALADIVAIDAFEYLPTVEKALDMLKEEIDSTRKKALDAISDFDPGNRDAEYYSDEDMESIYKALAIGEFHLNKSDQNLEQIFSAIEKVKEHVQNFEGKPYVYYDLMEEDWSKNLKTVILPYEEELEGAAHKAQFQQIDDITSHPHFENELNPGDFSKSIRVHGPWGSDYDEKYPDVEQSFLSMSSTIELPELGQEYNELVLEELYLLFNIIDLEGRDVYIEVLVNDEKQKSFSWNKTEWSEPVMVNLNEWAGSEIELTFLFEGLNAHMGDPVIVNVYN